MSWHFLWIICQVDNSRETCSYFLWEKKKKNICMSSVKILLGTSGVKLNYGYQEADD